MPNGGRDTGHIGHNMSMEYNGYVAKAEFDDKASLFHGEVENTRDVITFQGRNVAELRKAFRDSVDDYLAFCAERGEEPDKALSSGIRD
jgi:predicted HicB family RNase H-like nuclease